MAAFNVDAPVLGTRKAQALCPQPALPCCGHRAASPGWLSMAVKAFDSCLSVSATEGLSRTPDNFTCPLVS